MTDLNSTCKYNNLEMDGSNDLISYRGNGGQFLTKIKEIKGISLKLGQPTSFITNG